MSSELNRKVLANFAWLSVALLAAGVAWVLTLRNLHAREAQVAALHQSIDGKRRRLAQLPPPADRAQQAARLRRALATSERMLGNESQRVLDLSQIAQQSGVTLITTKNLERSLGPDGQLASCGHELEVHGDFRQIAAFLDGVYTASGTVGIDDLLIEPADVSTDGLLHAALRVTWFACPRIDLVLNANGEGT